MGSSESIPSMIKDIAKEIDRGSGSGAEKEVLVHYKVPQILDSTHGPAHVTYLNASQLMSLESIQMFLDGKQIDNDLQDPKGQEFKGHALEVIYTLDVLGRDRILHKNIMSVSIDGIPVSKDKDNQQIQVKNNGKRLILTTTIIE